MQRCRGREAALAVEVDRRMMRWVVVLVGVVGGRLNGRLVVGVEVVEGGHRMMVGEAQLG